MRKVFLLMMGCMLSGVIRAQHIDLGLHGGYGTTWMTNKNISDQGSELDPAASFAPLLGVHAGLAISQLLALRVEVNYAPIVQRYKGSYTYSGTTFELKAKEKASYLQVPLLVQLWSNDVFFFEIGPQFNFLTGAKGEYAVTAPNVSVLDTSGVNIKSDFRNFCLSGALGLGGNFRLTPQLFLTAGLRFAYGFTDATNEFSMKDMANRTSYVGLTSEYAHTKGNGDFGYEPTHTATAHILVGLSYRLGGKMKPKSVDDADTTLDPHAPVKLDKGSDDE